ncbi:MAG: ImmA/IrrE family metallo-endopeptidase [Candidatus Sumerlaeia bacterium]|nr:ImmA/IrrE family metallo-endopeptidase [Candidatus Sumerlaeia bacterium]
MSDATRGILRQTAGRTGVQLNESDSHFSQRFTLAHELAHFLIRRRVGPLAQVDAASSERGILEEEYACNYLAAAILVPEEVFHPDMEFLLQHPRRFLNLALNAFGVSDIVIINRIATHFGGIVLYWAAGQARNQGDEPVSRAEILPRACKVSWVFPPPIFRSRVFVPVGATPKFERFSPNIVLDAIRGQRDAAGTLWVRGLGSLPDGEYAIVCLGLTCSEQDFFGRRIGEKRRSDWIPVMASILLPGLT